MLININLLWRYFLVSLALLTTGTLSDIEAQSKPEVRLVLQITIDGLRADLINRYENGFGEGGFRFLMKVEHAIADALTDFDGIALAVASSRLASVNANPLVAKIRRNHHISRAGDIYIIQEPYWFLFDKGPVAAMHGSPWRYDTHRLFSWVPAYSPKRFIAGFIPWMSRRQLPRCWG